MRNSIWRTVVAACSLAILAALLPTTTANAQETTSCAIGASDYEGSATLTISPVAVEPGGTVTISGQGFPPGSSVPLAFNGEQFAAPITDSEGAFTITFTVPADIAPGLVSFTALCGAFTLTTQLTLTGELSATSTTAAGGGSNIGNTGGLTPTGANTAQLIQIAAALLAVGALLIFLARRQSRRRAPIVSV